MSANIKFQDLSISHFDQHLDVEGISGGTICFSKCIASYLSNLANRIMQQIRGCCPTNCTPVDWCGR